MRHVILRLALYLAGFAVLAPTAAAAPTFHRPTPGNQFVTTTDKYLYVVWSVPRDLQPFAGIGTREQLEAFVARSAVLLCKAHIAKEPTRTKDCKVQVVRLNSNDEYTKSAAGGFKTIATLIAPLSQISDDLVARVEQGLSLTALRPLFRKFNFVHEEITLGAK